MRQMHVGVEHVPGIDLLAAGRVGLVGQAHFDALSPGQCPIELGPCGCTGPQANARLSLPCRMQSRQPRRQRLGHGLGVCRACEAAHAHIGANGDQGRRFGGGHHFGVQAGVLKAFGQVGRQAHEGVPVKKPVCPQTLPGPLRHRKCSIQPGHG
jgi:hypothetical protein